MSDARLDYYAHNKDAILHLAGTRRHLKQLTPALSLLVELRVSQINGCAYCLSLHAPEARHAGLSQRQLDCLAAWREAGTLFDAQQRAALTWAESLTDIATTHAPDTDFDAVKAVFTDAEIVDLTLCIANINALNRVAVSLRRAPDGA